MSFDVDFDAQFSSTATEKWAKLMHVAAYVWFVACMLYPPQELVRSGLTIEKLLSFFLENEQRSFIRYHFMRIWCMLLVKACAVLGLVLFCFLNVCLKIATDSEWFYSRVAIVFVSYVCVGVLFGTLLCDTKSTSWHPLITALRSYDDDWQRLASVIDAEYSLQFKLVTTLAANKRLVVTRSWIMFVENCKVRIIKQADCVLVITSCVKRNRKCYVITLEVQSDNENGTSFMIHIDRKVLSLLMEFRSIRIINPTNISIYSDVEQFIQDFMTSISLNAKYDLSLYSTELHCIGCLQPRTLVKLQKACDDAAWSQSEVSNNEKCTPCYCRPTWCVECIMKWFLSRLNLDDQSRWWLTRCPCPNCRSLFCVMDVSLPQIGQQVSQ